MQEENSIPPIPPNPGETQAPNVPSSNKKQEPKKTSEDVPVQKKVKGKVNNDVISEVLQKIQESENVLVALSVDPTVDEMAAAIALTMGIDSTGKHATAIYSGKTPNVLEFLKPEETFEINTNSLQDFIIALNKDKADHLRYKVDGDYVKVFITPYKTTVDESDLEFSRGDYNVDLVISLNVPAATELDGALTEYGRIMHDATSINITNGTAGKFGDLEWVDSRASSCSEMVAELIFELVDKVDSSMATALLTGIISATDKFTNRMTTPEVMMLAGRLMNAGADQQDIMKNISQKLEYVDRKEPPKVRKPVKTVLDVQHGDEMADKGELEIKKMPEDGSKSEGDSDRTEVVSENQGGVEKAEEVSREAGLGNSVYEQEGTGVVPEGATTVDENNAAQMQPETSGTGNLGQIQAGPVGTEGVNPEQVMPVGTEGVNPGQAALVGMEGTNPGQASPVGAEGVNNSEVPQGEGGDLTSQILNKLQDTKEKTLNPLDSMTVNPEEGAKDYGKMIDEALAEPLPGEGLSRTVAGVGPLGNMGSANPTAGAGLGTNVNPAMVSAPSVQGMNPGAEMAGAGVGLENMQGANPGIGMTGVGMGLESAQGVNPGAEMANPGMEMNNAQGAVGVETNPQMGQQIDSGLPLPGQEIAPPPMAPMPDFGTLPPVQGMEMSGQGMGVGMNPGMNTSANPGMGMMEGSGADVNMGAMNQGQNPMIAQGQQGMPQQQMSVPGAGMSPSPGMSPEQMMVPQPGQPPADPGAFRIPGM